jgi:hypothetical protein
MFLFFAFCGIKSQKHVYIVATSPIMIQREDISMTEKNKWFKNTPKRFHVQLDDRNLKRAAAEDMDAPDQPLEPFIDPVVELDFDTSEQHAAQQHEEELRIIEELDDELG